MSLFLGGFDFYFVNIFFPLILILFIILTPMSCKFTYFIFGDILILIEEDIAMKCSNEEKLSIYHALSAK